MAKKKALLGVVCLAMVALIAVFGTVAFLTDRDSETNVFTSGDVSIELTEDFEQGAELLPGVDVEKEVVVTNTGKNDTWVWVTIAIPAALDNDNASLNALHFNMSSASVDAGQWTWWKDDNRETWRKEYNVDIEGKEYNVFTVLYQTALKPGETTETPAMYKVYLDKHIDIAPNGDWHHVEGGVVSEPIWNVEKNGNPMMYVSAYAIQKDPFTTVEDAYAAYGTQWGDKGAEYGEAPVLADTAAEFTAAIAAGEPVALTGDITITDTVNITKATSIDLNGHNLTVSRLEAKADTEISDGTVIHGKSTYPALSVSAGTLTMNNVKVVCEEPCNIVTSGTAEAAEYAGLEVWSGKCVLNNCDILVATDKIRYSNSVFGIGIYEGEVIMNGGSITIDSHGSTKANYDYQGAIFGGTSGDKVINLNNVAVTIADEGNLLFAWGGNTVVNTTDAEGSWTKIDARNGGTYTINYAK